MTLGAYDTTAVDGTRVDLGGGYLKEGKGRIALTATLAAVVFLPLIFIKGKSADLPRGTVFDAYAKQNVTVDVSGQKAAAQRINLSGAAGPRLQVEVLYDEITATENPENFAFSIKAPTSAGGDFVIDTINREKAEEALKLESKSVSVDGDITTWRSEIRSRTLARTSRKASTPSRSPSTSTANGLARRLYSISSFKQRSPASTYSAIAAGAGTGSPSSFSSTSPSR